jgi:hypothetical protein
MRRERRLSQQDLRAKGVSPGLMARQDYPEWWRAA